ncbi:metal-dependent protease [Novosphingobium nitrogenifigens DSM 19370]|uniref:Metal-dependent protease n=2 Tax=Novosphingobium nitrogenifigens TaxID=378548 RepID=F1Z7J3_9SPHN|nr:M67 family metallopeptidase [Novosphingobium nitrogenifigens]EGD59384.1 metal-dependent protease [Novosphingobium nitrogenifigens DSM 19370]
MERRAIGFIIGPTMAPSPSISPPSLFPLSISLAALDTLFEEARRCHPFEACGLLLGEGSTIATARPTANVAPDPARHFEIDPASLIAAYREARGTGPAVLGHFHSHPTGLARPSETDAAMATRDGRIWAIVANGDIGFWRDAPSGFEPLSYRVVRV